MARYEITSPDGQKYEITAPDDASQDQVLAYAQSQFKSASPKKETSLVDQIPGGVDPYKPPVDSGIEKKKTIGDRLSNLAAGLTATGAGILDIPSKITGLPWLKSELGGLQDKADKGSIEYIGGQVADPMAWAIGSGAMEKAQALSKVPKIVQAMLGGAAGSGTVAGLQGHDIGTAAGIGAAVPVALGGIGAVGRKAYNIADQFLPEGAKRAAGRAASDVAGDKADDVITALSRAGRTETAKQASTSSGSREFPGLMRMAEENMPTPTGIRMDEQIAGRTAALGKVKPDLNAAIAKREEITEPLYRVAKETVIKLDPEMLSLFSRMPKGTLEKAADIARMDKRPFQIGELVEAMEKPIGVLDASGKMITRNVPAQYPKITGESLHYIKRALSDISNSSPMTGIGADSQAAARGVLRDFLSAVETKIPKYGEAREAYASLSKPVNQSEIIQAIQDINRGVAGQERLSPLVNAMTRGEERLVQGATGFQGDLASKLTPRQLKVAEAVQAQMEKNKLAQQYASEGSAKARSVFQQDEIPITLPNLLSRPIALANAVIRRAEGHGKQATLDALGKLNLNPREMAEVMKNASEQQKKWMMEEIARRATPYTTGAQQTADQRR